MKTKCKGLARAAAAVLLAMALAVSAAPAVWAESAASQAEQTVKDENTIHIASRSDWEALARSCRLDSWSVGKTVVLDEDISLGSTFTPISTFGGTFEGQGHTISAMDLSQNGSVQGVFRYVQETGTIRQLTVQCRTAPSGSRCNVGGIAADNAGVMESCHFMGLVTGLDYVGGIAAVNQASGLIIDCTVQGVVYGTHFVGGVAGENKGVVRSCTNHASINTQQNENKVELSDVTLESLLKTEKGTSITNLGGIAGTSSGVIRACVNRGAVGYQHVGYNVGGIAGDQSGYIEGCENYGPVQGRKEAGGIVGQMEPQTVLQYGEDTLQRVQRQMNALKSQMDQMSDDVSATYNQKVADMQYNIDKANESLEKIKTYEKSGSDVREDAKDLAEDVWNSGSLSGAADVLKDRADAQRNEFNDRLNSALNAAQDFNSSITDDSSLDSVTADMKAITTQLNAISATITGTADRIRNHTWYSDISDRDTDADTAAKVTGCVNYARVDADRNAGGIAGAMAFENDLDPEDDIEDTLGTESMNATVNTRCVLSKCTNQGQVSGKKDSVGGIAGRQKTGVLKNCESYGPVQAPDAKSVGGIVGASLAAVRESAAKCLIEGDSHVGGVAGTGFTITDCRTMVRINSEGEYIGAIAGEISEQDEENTKIISLRDAKSTVSGNCFVENDALFGIDGVSYQDKAWGVSYDEMMQLDYVPESFAHLTVQFMVDGTQVSVRQVEYGGSLSDKDLPELPAREHEGGKWSDFVMTDITEDQIVEAVYSPAATVLASSQKAGSQPLVLAEGYFTAGQTLKLTDLSDAPQVEGTQLIAAMRAEVSGGDAVQRQLRYCVGKKEASRCSVWLRSGQVWQRAESSADGSYLVFTMPEGETDFAVLRMPPDLRLPMACTGAAALLLLLMAVHRRRKKRAAKAAQAAKA